MKIKYKIPIIITCIFFAVFPNIPNIYWIVCEIYSNCSNENPNIGGINFFGHLIYTNIFDVIPVEPNGYLLLIMSLLSMGIAIFVGVRK